MNSHAKLTGLLCLTFVCTAFSQTGASIPTWTPEKAPKTETHTLFLTDDLLVFQQSSNTTDKCRTAVLKLTSRGFQKITGGTFERINHVDESFFYVDLGQNEVSQPPLLTRMDATSLKPSGIVPMPHLISTSGSTVLSEDWEKRFSNDVRSRWDLYRMDSSGQPILVRTVGGWPWTLSDSMVVLRDKDSVVIETIDGSRISSFPLQKGIEAYFALDKERILQIGEKVVSVVDLHGNEIRSVPMYPVTRDLSFSRDGNRILWQSPVRNRNALQLVWDALRLIPTLTVFESRATAKATRVVDTQTGGICMEEVYQEKDFEESDTALSPSGKLVAKFRRGTLSLYELPDACAEKPIKLKYLPGNFSE
jgi:hypothetical protein